MVSIAAPDSLAVVPSFARELPLTGAAIRFAEDVHRGRLRESDHARFILHPLEVAALLHAFGAPDAVVAAAILHDAVEEQGAALAEIERRFGGELADLVGALTENPAIGRHAARKAALRRQVALAGVDAATIFAADKVAKVRELRVRLAQARTRGDHDPVDAAAKLEHYRASLAMLSDRLPDHPLVGLLRFELETLSALPPGPRPEAITRLARYG
jgi:(p)ppGpp synthase/HD superfamily hydrolase